MQDPSIPVHRKGVLISFINGQPMPIPEKDNVKFKFLKMLNKFYFSTFLKNFLQAGKCRPVSEFEKLNRIGEGTYGIVCKNQSTQIPPETDF